MTAVEAVARIIDPDVFLLPRIALYRRRYEEAFAKARAALAAIRTPTPKQRDVIATILVANGMHPGASRRTAETAYTSAIDAEMEE